MKLRIKDSAVRFRITLKELDALHTSKRLEKVTWVPPQGDEEPQVFRYALTVNEDAIESRLIIEPFSMTAELSPSDLGVLSDEKEEGVYVRHKWQAPDGSEQRFMFFVEKDRPGSTCVKPEEWVYEERLGERPITKPIGS